MPRPRFLSISCLALLLFSSSSASEPSTAPDTANTAERLRRGVLRMSEFFDTMLPGVLQEHNVTLHVTPKFSDLRDHEFVRYPFELRYGASQNVELSGGLTPFSPQPFNRGRDHRWGLGEAKLGLR